MKSLKDILYIFTLFGISILFFNCTDNKKDTTIEGGRTVDENSKNNNEKIGEILEDGNVKILLDTFLIKNKWNNILKDSFKNKINKISIKERLLEDRVDTTFYYLSAESKDKGFTIGKLLLKKNNILYFFDNSIDKGFDEDSEIAFEGTVTCYSQCENKCEPSLFKVNSTYYWSCQGCEFDCEKAISIGM